MIQNRRIVLSPFVSKNGHSEKSSARAALKMTIGAVLISFSAVYVKLAHVTPTVAGFYRVFLGTCVLFPLIFLSRKKHFRGKNGIMTGILCGFIFFLDLFLWHKSIHHIGPGLATIVTNFQVFILGFYGIIVLGEGWNAKIIIAVPLAIIGLFMIVGIDMEAFRGSFGVGILFALGAAFAYAVFVLVLRKLQSGSESPSPMGNLVVISLASSVFLAGMVFGEGGSFAIPDIQTGVSLIFYGVFSQVVGWILITNSLPDLKASVAGLILLFQPSLAFVWDMLFFRPETTALNVFGAILAISAIYFGTSKSSR